MPSSDNPEGMVVDAIRFRITERRGDDPTLSPDLISLTLEYRKILETAYGFQVLVNLGEDNYEGRNSRELREALAEAIDSDTLVEFVYRPEEEGDERIHYVNIERVTMSEETGRSDQATALIVMTEA